MTVPNLGVCFGPTLLRPPEESVTAIMNIKWCNIVVEQLIYNFERVGACLTFYMSLVVLLLSPLHGGLMACFSFSRRHQTALTSATREFYQRQG